MIRLLQRRCGMVASSAVAGSLAYLVSCDIHPCVRLVCAWSCMMIALFQGIAFGRNDSTTLEAAS